MHFIKNGYLLAATNPRPMLFKKILIAVNDDDYARKPAELGFKMAKAFDAEVALIFVIDPQLRVANMDTSIPVLDILDILKKEAEDTLGRLTRQYAHGMPVTRFTPEGKPTAEILNTAKEWQADLIVMGTHGRSGLLQLFTGSISAYVKHHSKVPVLIVPTQREK